MCFLYLLLGHLLGDFILQTNIIANRKVKDWQWNVLHSIVVTVCLTLFAVPFGLKVIALVFLNGVLHYFIDYYKPLIASRHSLPGLIYFLADQCVHILVLYLISIFADVNTGFLFLNIRLLKVLIVAAFVSSFSAILNQYILGTIFPSIKKKFFESGEKGVGNLARLLMAFGIYFSFSISILFFMVAGAGIALLIFHYKISWSNWMSKSFFAAAILLDCAISLAGSAFLLF